jgi:ABC-type phosphate/phosphonate transport system permease subunit
MGIVSSDNFYNHSSFVKFTFSPFFFSKIWLFENFIFFQGVSLLLHKKEVRMSHMLGGLVRKTLAKIAASTAASTMAVLSTVPVAFAASTDSGLSPEYNQILRLAEEKVRAATQPGAFGNGVPVMNMMNIDMVSVFPWMGVAAAVAIGAVVAAKLFAQRMRN